MSGFGEYAHKYKSAGWHPIPIPHGVKSIAGTSITGYTGQNGRNASGADIQEWIDGGHNEDNIGLRITDNVIGIDVDDYDGKQGGDTLKALETELGPLPATWRSSSRADDSVSGIRFFRVPDEAVRYCSGFRGIEIIQHHHRYAVVHPSTHTSGSVYTWHNKSGKPTPTIPRVEQLAELPQKWVEHLKASATTPATITAPDAAPVSLTDGPSDAEVAHALENALTATRGESGSRHDATLGHVNRIVRLAEQGHAGTAEALSILKVAFVESVGDTRGDVGGEFDRMVAGAQEKVGQTPSPEHATVAAAAAAEEMVDAINTRPATVPQQGPVARRAVDMATARRKQWLAEGRVPQGQLTLLVGAEGIGKSAWWVWLVAKLTTGTPAPEFGITGTTARKVVLIITEDPWSTDVLPRLIAAGANLEMITVVSEDVDGEGSPTLPDHLDRIPEDSDLVIVDAWSDTLPPNLSVRDSQQARRALHPLKEWCARTDTAMLLVTHTNRLSTGSTRDAYGSTGELRKAARSSLLAQQEPETEDILTVGTDKSNGARVGVASRFQTYGVVTDHDIETVAVRFLGQADTTAAQQFQAAHDAGDDKGESKDCVTWLQEFLTTGNGSAEAKVIKSAAKAEMYSDRALGNAKRALHVKSMKAPMVDNGPWLWVLPSD